MVVREEGTNLAFLSINFNLKILVKNSAVFVAQVGNSLTLLLKVGIYKKKPLLIFSLLND